MEAQLDVLALGRACVDVLLEVDAYPREDSKVRVMETLREGGGQASTAACLVAHLGGRSAFLGVLGDDPAGQFARSRMAAYAVDLSRLPPARGGTPMAYCVVSRRAASRTILYQASAAAPLAAAEVPDELLARSRSLLVDPQARHLLPTLIPSCRDRGIPVIADAEHAGPGWRDTWAEVDVLAVSRSFLAEVAPGATPAGALEILAGHCHGTCVATLGAEGAVAWLAGSLRRYPATPVAVRDTTGAGDAFHAALALGLARGCDLDRAVRRAVHIASLCCRGFGGRSFPTLAEVADPFPAC